MVSSAQHATKSRFLAGRRCPKRLLLGRHRPDRAAPLSDGVRAIRTLGDQVGRLARNLFTDGVLVGAGPRQHADAVLETRKFAAAAFHEIASGESKPERVARLREQLLAYCALDTLALVQVHRALCERVSP